MSLCLLVIATMSQQPLLASSPAISRARYLMGTICRIDVPRTAGSEEAVSAAFDEIARVEAMLSTWRDDSELARLNAAPAGKPAAVSPELEALLRRTASWQVRSGNAFSPLAGQLIQVWDLRGAGRIPSPTELAAARHSALPEEAKISEGAITRFEGVRFEEGGFGKGYALDRAVAILRAHHIPSALLDFGGQIAHYGDRSLTLSVADPLNRMQAALTLTSASLSASTSSGSEKQFAQSGRRFCHIVDPRTGEALPPRGSVTVFADSAFDADVLSTALYVMGPEEGIPWAEANGVAALFLAPDDSGFRVLETSAAIRTIRRAGQARNIHD